MTEYPRLAAWLADVAGADDILLRLCLLVGLVMLGLAFLRFKQPERLPQARTLAVWGFLLGSLLFMVIA